MNEETIAYTDFQHSGAGDLVQYIDRDGTTLKHPSGRELTEEEKEIFIKKSQYHEFERHVVVSPAQEGMDAEAVEAAARQTTTEYFDLEEVDYVVGVHTEGGDRPHAHIALTGPQSKLEMDPEDCRDLHEVAHEQVLEHEYEVANELVAENDLEPEPEPELDPEHEL